MVRSTLEGIIQAKILQTKIKYNAAPVHCLVTQLWGAHVWRALCQEKLGVIFCAPLVTSLK